MFVVAEHISADVIDLCETHFLRLLPIALTETRSHHPVRYDNIQVGGVGRMRNFVGPYFMYILVKFCLERVDGKCTTGNRVY
jgi:hypothetical protein